MRLRTVYSPSAPRGRMALLDPELAAAYGDLQDRLGPDHQAVANRAQRPPRQARDHPGGPCPHRSRRAATQTVPFAGPATGSQYAAPRIRIRQGDRIVVDEVGMLDLEATHALLEIVDRTGAGVALVGDQHQALPVGHSGAMALFWLVPLAKSNSRQSTASGIQPGRG